VTHRPLTPEQAEAVEARDVDVFCEAGAGTGKTSVLVERFVAAVCDDEVPLDQMLAFTFTERAADQLRRRVREGLRSRGRGDLARETESAWISTIHGFCRRLLAAHPVAAGVDPRFRVIDQGEGGRLAARAFTGAVEQVLRREEPELAGRVVATATPIGLRSIVTGAYDELRSRGHERPELPEIEPSDPARALAELGPAAEAAIEECEGRVTKQVELISGVLESLEPGPSPVGLDQLIALGPDKKATPFSKGKGLAYLDAYTRARRALAEVELADAYALIRRLLVAYGTRYEQLKAARSGLDFEDLQLRSVALLRGNEAVGESYAGRFRHLLVDEFQDTNELQRSLIAALQGAETRLFCVGDELQSIYGFRHADLGVFRRERSRFARIDRAEGRLVALTGNFRSRPELIAAINALGEALIGGAMPGGFEPLTVGSEEQGEGQAPGGSPAVELLLTAAEKAQDWSAKEVGLELEEDEPAPPSRVAEARLLARRLRELADGGVSRKEMVVLLRSYTHIAAYERALAHAGLAPYVVGGRGYWSQQQVEDTLALLAVIANPLDDEALAGALSGSACGVSPDTLWLLHRVAGKRRLVSALREVAGLAERKEDVEYAWAEAIADEEVERLTRFAARIDSLRERTPTLGLEGTIEAACEELRYDLATLMRDRGPERWANVRKLMRLAREYEANEGADLRGFLAYAADETTRGDEGEAPIAAEEHDGVRVLTIHAVKGLEFEVVAAAGLGRRLLAGFAPAIRIGTIEPAGDEEPEGPAPLRVGLRLARLGRPSERLFELDELAATAETEESAEELRLAHVAATRARGRLILSGTFDSGRDPAKQMTAGVPVTDRLVAALDGELAELRAACASGEAEIEAPAPSPRPGLEAAFGPGRIRVELSLAEPGAGARLAARAGAPERGPEPVAAVAPPLLAPAAPAASASRLSYSALSSYERCGYRFYAERELGLAPPARNGAGLAGAAAVDEGGPDPGDEPSREQRFGFGNTVHRLLEWSARRGWSEPGAERTQRVLRSEGLDPAAARVERAQVMVSGWLGSDLCGRLREGGATLAPEAPFLLPLDGALIRGSIDLLARMDDGSVLVLDYKTDALDGDPPAERAAGYAVQRDLYALAASALGEPVRTAYVFLEQPGEPAEEEFAPDGLEAARERSLALLAGIAIGGFEVTHHPHRALCHDCPARERLCSHSAEVQMRNSPEPAVTPQGPPASAGQLSLLG
jgi:ATP-dependent helicase/nuclease subunit A